MAKKQPTQFIYYINGKGYPLTAGKDGVTEEVITVLRDSYHREYLNNRYEKENSDPLFELHKDLYEKKPSGVMVDNPINQLEDSSSSVEHILFKEEASPTLRDKVHNLIPHLIPSQQELYWQLSEGKSLVEIANSEGTTDNAIRSRRRKMFARLKALYEEIYGDE